jgi:3-oxoacyl-[acyl-carrier protein] reductase
MELGLKNKVAFIAASSQGLGKSVALELAQEGARIIICARNKENLEKAKEEIEKQTTSKVLAFAGDLSVAAERDQIIKSVLEAYKTIDILVTNTGGPPTGKIEDLNQRILKLTVFPAISKMAHLNFSKIFILFKSYVLKMIFLPEM